MRGMHHLYRQVAKRSMIWHHVLYPYGMWKSQFGVSFSNFAVAGLWALIDAPPLSVST